MKISKISLNKKNKTDCISKKPKTGSDLKELLGILEGDGEYKIIQKELKARWRKWTERYAK